jgi:hypothetical protein
MTNSCHTLSKMHYVHYLMMGSLHGLVGIPILQMWKVRLRVVKREPVITQQLTGKTRILFCFDTGPHYVFQVVL